MEADTATFDPCIKVKCIKIKWKERASIRDSQKRKHYFLFTDVMMQNRCKLVPSQNAAYTTVDRSLSITKPEAQTLFVLHIQIMRREIELIAGGFYS